MLAHNVRAQSMLSHTHAASHLDLQRICTRETLLHHGAASRPGPCQRADTGCETGRETEGEAEGETRAGRGRAPALVARALFSAPVANVEHAVWVVACCGWLLACCWLSNPLIGVMACFVFRACFFLKREEASLIQLTQEK